MAIGSVRIEHNWQGIGELLTRSETEAMMSARAEAVASQAKAHAPLVEGVPGSVALPIVVVNAPLSARCRFQVAADHPAGAAVEAKHRLLGGALDAAKGW